MSITQNNIDKLLGVLGFSDTEAKVLLHLLHQSPSTGGLIAKRTRLKRPTTYSALSNLVEKGLVQKIINGRTAFFAITDPHNFQNILSQTEQLQYEKRQSAITQLRLELEKSYSSAPQHIGEFEVSLIDHNPVFSLQLSSLTAGSFDSIFDPSIVVQNEKSKSVCEKFLEDTSISRPCIRELIPPGQWAEWYINLIKNPNHQVRLLPKECRITSDIILQNDEVHILNYTIPVQGLKIKQSAFYISMSSCFDALWQLSKR